MFWRLNCEFKKKYFCGISNFLMYVDNLGRTWPAKAQEIV